MPGIYVHIPFCRRKCYYCDFFSVGSRNAPREDFCEALLRESGSRAAEWEDCTRDSSAPRTLYIGGGTPSQLPPRMLAGLIRRLKDIFRLPHPDELTVEVNPEDVTTELVTALTEAGVNRVSMGVQTFCDAELQAIGRRHTGARALEAYALLRPAFTNISLDLIFGLPGQSLESWRHTVERAVNLLPEHISAYSLMWEERTALSRMRTLGRVEECDEDLSADMYALLTDTLHAAGYEHYEISNYCLPGRASLHNSSYWSGEPYIGIGPGAHSYDGCRRRRSNPCDITAYIAGTSLPEEELLTDEELHEEYLLTRLRRLEGISLADFADHFGAEATDRMRRRAALQTALLTVDSNNIRLAPEGVMRSDAAILALL